MDLLLATIVSGIAVGSLYGLLGFSMIFLFKATGVINFAQGTLGMAVAFLIYEVARDLGVSTAAAALLVAPAAAVLGIVVYESTMRPRATRSDRESLAIRTIGLFVLVAAVCNTLFSEGQPFRFDSVAPSGRLDLGMVVISGLDLARIGVAVLFAGAAAWFFRATSFGALYRAVAERPDVARVLGVNVRLLSGLAWAFAVVIAGVVAVLTAPTSLLSTNMLDAYLPYALTAAVIGGFTSLFGVFVGGAVVGTIQSLASVYTADDQAFLAVFLLMILVLLFKPDGFFGTQLQERF